MPTPAPQLDLFDKGPPVPPPAKWIGHRGPWGRNLTWTRPDMPRIIVRHCGHGTALRPYYITVGDSLAIASPGLFRSLADCQAAAARLYQDLSRTPTP
jgi:hypothetical protein